MVIQKNTTIGVKTGNYQNAPYNSQFPNLYTYSATIEKPVYEDASIKRISTYISSPDGDWFLGNQCETFLSNGIGGNCNHALTIININRNLYYVVICIIRPIDGYNNWEIIFNLDNTGYNHFLSWQDYAANQNFPLVFQVCFYMR